MRRVMATCAAVVALGAVAIAPSTAFADKGNALRACERSDGKAARCLGEGLEKGGQACFSSKGNAARCPGPPE